MRGWAILVVIRIVRVIELCAREELVVCFFLLSSCSILGDVVVEGWMWTDKWAI